MAVKDPALANCVAMAIKNFDETLILYGLSGSVMITEGDRIQLRTAMKFLLTVPISLMERLLRNTAKCPDHQ